jgi:hypothetical protein
MLSSIAEIIRDLLIFIIVMAALLITLVVVISKMPDSNPLKRLLTALSYRLGATLAAGHTRYRHPLRYRCSDRPDLVLVHVFQRRTSYEVRPPFAARSAANRAGRSMRQAMASRSLRIKRYKDRLARKETEKPRPAGR